METIKFETTGLEINPSYTRSSRVQVRADVDVNELLDSVGVNAIKGYLEDKGFKAEKL